MSRATITKYWDQRAQPKPLVRFRINGGGQFVHTGVEWVKADREIMTNIANTLFHMARFAEKV